MKSPNCTTVVEVKGIIHDPIIKSFDSVIKLNGIFMTSLTFSTVVEVKEIIHDTVRKTFDSVITLNDVLMTIPNCTTVAEVKENIHDTVTMVFMTTNVKTKHISQFHVMLTQTAN